MDALITPLNHFIRNAICLSLLNAARGGDIVEPLPLEPIPSANPAIKNTKAAPPGTTAFPAVSLPKGV